MAIHQLRFYPDPVLLKAAEPVTEFDDALRELIEDMFETMYHESGVGLAAPQIGISKQITVIDTTVDKTERIVLINPEIIATDDIVKMEEGCLSVPGARSTLKRARKATVRAQDEYGKTFEISGEDVLAEAFQHEIDHLHGKLYVHHLSSLKRHRVLKQLEKYKRQNKIN